MDKTEVEQIVRAYLRENIMTPWINSPLLKWEISILNYKSDATFQSQIDALDGRVTSTEDRLTAGGL